MCSRSRCFAGCFGVVMFGVFYNVDWTTADSAGVRLPTIVYEILWLSLSLEFENVARPPDISGEKVEGWRGEGTHSS